MNRISTVELRVEVDRESLSLIGWELDWFRAELFIEDAHLPGSGWTHHVLARGNIRRFPPLRRPFGFGYRFGGFRHMPPLVWQVRSQKRGALGGYLKIEKQWGSERWLRHLSPGWVSSTQHDPSDLYVWVGATDWADVDARCGLSVNWIEVPVEVADQTTHTAMGTVVREPTARIRDNEALEVTMSLVHPLWSAAELIAMSTYSVLNSDDPEAPIEDWDLFLVHTPDITFDIYDQTGRLLDSRTLDNDRWVQLEGGAPPPTRYPCRVVVTTKPLEELDGSPAHVVVKLTDSGPPVGEGWWESVF